MWKNNHLKSHENTVKNKSISSRTLLKAKMVYLNPKNIKNTKLANNTQTQCQSDISQIPKIKRSISNYQKKTLNEKKSTLQTKRFLTVNNSLHQNHYQKNKDYKLVRENKKPLNSISEQNRPFIINQQNKGIEIMSRICSIKNRRLKKAQSVKQRVQPNISNQSFGNMKMDQLGENKQKQNNIDNFSTILLRSKVSQKNRNFRLMQCKIIKCPKIPMALMPNQTIKEKIKYQNQKTENKKVQKLQSLANIDISEIQINNPTRTSLQSDFLKDFN